MLSNLAGDHFLFSNILQRLFKIWVFPFTGFGIIKEQVKIT